MKKYLVCLACLVLLFFNEWLLKVRLISFLLLIYPIYVFIVGTYYGILNLFNKKN